VTGRLPRSTDELAGLRAAHWGRESTGRQADRFGPEAQREQRDQAIRRYALVDSGISWQVAHSGRTIASTAQWAEMLSRAGRDYDVLVVGYVSRFARDLRTAVNARHDLHLAGASILFADERVLSSDEEAWETWAREAVEAEAYSRRLGKRIREGYAAKRRRLADPGGQVPHGFQRAGPQHTVEPDPATMPAAIAAYRLAALGTTDAAIAAELGLSLWTVRGILRSRLYAGELADGTPTRFEAPVPRGTVEQAWSVRRERARSGHAHGRHRVYPLTDRGPLACGACGRFLKGAFRTDRGLRVYRHPDRCGAWRYAEASAELLERQVGQLLAGARPNRESAARIRRALAAPVVVPDRLALARLDLEARTLALELVAPTRSQREILAELEANRARRAELEARPIDPEAIDPEAAIAYLEELGALWAETSDAGRRALAVATFARLEAVDRRIVEVDVTPDAERRGLVLALPGKVTMVGDTGLGPPVVTWRIRIARRDDWLRAARSA
jgi:DNA invertase Pin-like site-specific DNA recombinase